MNEHIPYPSRRAFLAGAAKSCLGVAAASPFFSLPNSALAARTRNEKGGQARSVIYLFMMGGMSHIDTFDPKPRSDSQGPVQAIRTRTPGVQLSGFLPRTAKESKGFSIVRSLSSKEGSHPRGQYQMHTNYPPLGTIEHPSMASWVLRQSGRINEELPGSVVVGRDSYGAGFLGTDFEPYRVGNPEDGLSNITLPRNVPNARFAHRLSLLDDLDAEFRRQYPTKGVTAYSRYYEEALKMMHSDDVQAFDLSKESERMRAAYGETSFGQGLLLARRLVQTGVRYVEVTLNGWDTHQDNFTKVEELSARFDLGFSTLMQDLRSQGLLDEVLLVVGTEFGRTPRINGNDGRDHYPKAFSGLLAGAGVSGGEVYGATDANGANVKENPVSPMDFNATIATALGVDPDRELRAPSGRPFKMCNGGKPIRDLLA